MEEEGVFGLRSDLDVNAKSTIERVTHISELKTYNSNPFLTDFQIREKIELKKIKDVGSETNAYDEEVKLVLAKELQKDKELFIKIFHFSRFPLDVSSMSGSACKLFLYIAYHKLNRNMDFINISFSEIKAKGIIASETTYNGALLELLNSFVLAKDGNHNSKFWINPYMIFHGNRKLLKLRKK